MAPEQGVSPPTPGEHLILQLASTKTDTRRSAESALGPESYQTIVDLPQARHLVVCVAPLGQ
jgi:hypothetical protein